MKAKLVIVTFNFLT